MYDIIFILFSNRPDALQKNQDMEFERNKERFMFLKVSKVIFHNYAYYIDFFKHSCLRSISFKIQSFKEYHFNIERKKLTMY